jgi:hypothetical protein
MKNLITLLILVTSFFACKQSAKKEENSITAAEVKQEIKSDWVVLFDGTSLDKWRGYLTDTIFPEWTIEDNSMVFTPSEKGQRNIITKEKYTDFILTLDWKISEGGNSGFFWGVIENPDLPEVYQSGPEIQILDNERHPDSFVEGGTHKAGSLYDMVACDPSLINPAGEWNTCELTINHKKNEGIIVMNGTEAVKFPVHGNVWDTMVEDSKFKDWEHFGKYQTGHIALQDHGNKVWFKNIKIKEL